LRAAGATIWFEIWGGRGSGFEIVGLKRI